MIGSGSISPYFRRGGGSQSPSTLLDELVSAYMMNGDSTDSLALNNGTDTNMSYSALAGKVDDGASFVGTSYIEHGAVSTYSYIQNTLEFTIAFWIKPSDYTTSFFLMGNTATTTEKGFYVLYNSASKRFEMDVLRGVNASPTLTSQSQTDTLTNNDYVCIVITGDGTEIKYYLNGSEIVAFNSGSGILSSGDSDRTSMIGAINYAPVLDDFTGYMDVVCFWNRPLEPEEITEFYNSGTGKEYPFFFNALGFKMSPLNANIAGMTPTDSGSVVDLGNGNLGYFWGWEAVSTYANNWWKSTDGGETWTVQGALPFASAHVTTGLRNDGLIWMWGVITGGVDIGKSFVCTFDPDLETFDTINISAAPLAGDDAQWGVFHKNEMYLARYIGANDVDLYKFNTGTNLWAKYSDLPAANFWRSAAYSDGTNIRLTGGGLFDGGSNTVDLVEWVYLSTDDGLNFSQEIALPEPMQSLWPNLFYQSGRLFYVQGYRSQPRDDGHVYIWTGSTWFEVEEWTWLDGRHAVANCSFNGKQILMCGYLHNDCFQIERL